MTNFEWITQTPKDLAWFFATNVMCEHCDLQKYCKQNLKEDDDCQDVWLKWLNEQVNNE